MSLRDGRRRLEVDARLVALVQQQRQVIALQDQELAQVRLEALAQEEASHRALKQLVLDKHGTPAAAAAAVLESSGGASEARQWEEEEHRAALTAAHEQIATLERARAALTAAHEQIATLERVRTAEASVMTRLQCDYDEALAELRTWRSESATAAVTSTDDARGLVPDDRIGCTDTIDSADSVGTVATATPKREALMPRAAEASPAQRGAEGGAMYAAFTAYAQSLIEENLVQKAELERLQQLALRTSTPAVEMERPR